MTDPLSAVRTRGVPQTVQTDPAQELNAAGGYTFVTGWEQQLTRFLILGTIGGTFYASEREHTVEVTDRVRKIIAEHGAEAVRLIVAVSVAGRAPKQQPTLFALAVAAADPDVEVRQAALAALPLVARTGTMLFQFIRYAEQFRGHSKGFNRALARWYTDKTPDDLAFQLVKYQSREGWSHRDVLRLAKPTPARGSSTDLALRWAVGRGIGAPPTGVDGDFPGVPRVIFGSVAIKDVATPNVAATIIRAYGLPWEAVPTELLNERVVWEALLERLPVGAMLRQLPRLTRLGLLDAGDWRGRVVGKLTDPDVLKRARLHPLTILNALMAYKQGDARSGGAFRPVPQIVDALDAAFYAAFGTVTPVGRPTLLAIDVSGSMAWDSSRIAGTSLHAREAAAALALITAATEPDYEVVAFADGIMPVTISPRQRLDDVIATLDRLPATGTDCALPMIDAMTRQVKVDLFEILTDNETWYGVVHPHVALRNYRDRMSRPDARCVVVGMTGTKGSIADPSDPRMLDVVGFDTATPELISQFGRGEL